MEFNVVVKLKEDELSRFAEAISVTRNLTAKVELEKAVTELSDQKEKIWSEVEDLKEEKAGLLKTRKRLEKEISNLHSKKRTSGHP